MNTNKVSRKGKKGTLKRLLKYIFSIYRKELILVVICIILTSLSSVLSGALIQKLIDEVIVSGISSGMDSVRDRMFQLLTMMACIYLMGVFTSYTYTQIMARVTQGSLKGLRSEMFHRMQSLPIRYFDTHKHGEIMSTYTNDTDAIRQLIGQSIPTFIQAMLTVSRT